MIIVDEKIHFVHTWFLYVLEQDFAEEWPDEFKNLQQVFRKHIKPKKKHEIIRMADVASMLASKANSKAKANVEAELKAKEEESKNIIDIGGGLGHLSRLEWPYKIFEVSGKESKKSSLGQTPLIMKTKITKTASPKKNIWTHQKYFQFFLDFSHFDI